MHCAFLELEGMETCDDYYLSFKEGRGSVSKSSLRSVMSTSVRSTLMSFKIVAVCKDEDDGCN